MNASNARDYLPLVKALAEGRVIEHKGRAGWYTADEPSFDFPPEQYRIKPEPREIWVVEHSDSSMSVPHTTPMDAIKDQTLGSTLRHYREVIA